MGRTARALVADDELQMRELIGHELTELGMECVLVTNGRDAVERFAQESFDLLVLDLGMPVMNGLEACRMIRAHARGRFVPILFVTAIDRTDHIVEGFAAGASDYILKPFSVPELKARVTTQLKAYHQLKEMVDEEKRRSLLTLTAGLCHEVLNPLQIIVGHLSILEMNPEAAPFIEKIRAMSRGAGRIQRVISALHDYSREAPENDVDLQIQTVVERALDLTRPHLKRRRLQVTHDPDPRVPTIRGRPNRLTQVFVQLLTNAGQYVNEDGWVKIVSTASEGFVRVTITDSGPGIRPEDLDQVCDPFFTGKQVWDSPGLGLSVAQRIVNDHGGRLEVNPVSGAGTEFRISLPIP